MPLSPAYSYELDPKSLRKLGRSVGAEGVGDEVLLFEWTLDGFPCEARAHFCAVDVNWVAGRADAGVKGYHALAAVDVWLAGHGRDAGAQAEFSREVTIRMGEAERARKAREALDGAMRLAAEALALTEAFRSRHETRLLGSEPASTAARRDRRL